MSPKNDVKKLISTYKRRLQKLKEKQALKGINAEPELLIEIEDIEEKIERCQTELKFSEGGHVINKKTQKSYRRGFSLFRPVEKLLTGTILTIIRAIWAYNNLSGDLKQTADEFKESFTNTLSEYGRLDGKGPYTFRHEERKGIFKEAQKKFSLHEGKLDINFEIHTKVESGYQKSITIVTGGSGVEHSTDIQGFGGTYVSATTRPKGTYIEPPQPPDAEV